MVERDRREDKQENISALGLSPFKSTIYRTLWIAVLFSYVGAAMYDVGASWLMTSLAPNPLLFLYHNCYYSTNLSICVTIGILSDIFDRRSILLITCAYMFTISTMLGILTLIGLTTPTILIDTYFCTRSRYDYD